MDQIRSSIVTEMRHYPYKCFVCEERKNLKRCSGCKMISYCCKEHQTQHRSEHKNFCKIISEILKSQKKSHIYENIVASNWFKEKEKIIHEVMKKSKRPPTEDELYLLNYPRLCSICLEANQDKLKTCPKCLMTSFCTIHSNNSIHDKNCRIDSDFKNNFSSSIMDPNLKSLVTSIVNGLKILKSDDSTPTSMEEFFEFYTKHNKIFFDNLNKNSVALLSEIFSIPLTLFNALKTVYSNIPSNLIIFLKIQYDDNIMSMKFWETLLHLLPNVKNLKIIYFPTDNLNPKKLQIDLCKDCNIKKKNLIIENQQSYTDNDEPSLIAVFDLQPSNIMDFFHKIDYFKTTTNKFTCPLLITVPFLQNLTEIESLNLFTSYRKIYHGYNDFSSLIEQPVDIKGRYSQFITILLPDDENFYETFSFIDNDASYYHQICHFCHKMDGKIICKHCKFVSYCNRKHQNQHQIHHKDLCDVICCLQQKMIGKQLFSNVTTTDPEEWLRMRIEILNDVQMKIGKKLTKFEEEMFLFPKNCGICHDCNSNSLKSCECGVFLCKKHKNDPQHKKICQQLKIVFKMSTNPLTFNKGCFIETIFSLLKEISDKLFNGKLPVSMKMLTPPTMNEISVKSDNLSKILFANTFLSSPLTLFYAIEKLSKKINSSAIVIHVIGAKQVNFEKKFLWAFHFYQVNEIEKLKLIFIDEEFCNFPEIDVINNSEMKRNIKIEGHALNYDNYFSSNKFIKPDFIIGFDLNIHYEKKLLSTSEKVSKETILAMEKLKVPFIHTAGTKERAENNHKMICDSFEKSMNFEFFEENPFGSLCPERDFETTGVMYSNKYIIAYDWKLKNSSEGMEKINAKEFLKFENIHLESNENNVNPEEAIQENIEKNLKNESKENIPTNLNIEIKEILTEKINNDNENLKFVKMHFDTEEKYSKETIPKVKIVKIDKNQENESEKIICESENEILLTDTINENRLESKNSEESVLKIKEVIPEEIIEKKQEIDTEKINVLPESLNIEKKGDEKIEKNNLQSDEVCSKILIQDRKKIKIQRGKGIIKQREKINVISENIRKIKQESLSEKIDKNESLQEEKKIIENKSLQEEKKIIQNENLQKEKKIIENKILQEEKKLIKNEDLQKEKKIIENKILQQEKKIIENKSLQEEKKIIKNEDLQKEKKIIQNENLQKEKKIIENKSLQEEKKIMKNVDLQKEKKIIKNEDLQKEKKIMKNEDLQKEMKIIENKILQQEKKIIENKSLQEENKIIQNENLQKEEKIIENKILQQEKKIIENENSKVEKMIPETNQIIDENQKEENENLMSKEETLVEQIIQREDSKLIEPVDFEKNDSKIVEIIIETKEIIQETEDKKPVEIKITSNDSMDENLSSAKQILSLQIENEKLRQELNLSEKLNEKLKNQILVYQTIYPNFMDKSNLIKEALECITKNITSAFEKE
ncbi:reticulocyte-binding protein homolog 2b-like [Leptopilina boulardi]|uniref:reticulocyte-binding protein homolog 2b-like n=1 Tax=Leptopilina boulardi TaxID=63433 RepID=UPI0021F6303B|nr:reticulocyte-binding protein homolog 2b-like [Leptopilina boulardi]